MSLSTARACAQLRLGSLLDGRVKESDHFLDSPGMFLRAPRVASIHRRYAARPGLPRRQGKRRRVAWCSVTWRCGVEPHTAATWRGYLDRHIAALIGGRPLGAVNAEVLDSLMRSCAAVATTVTAGRRPPQHRRAHLRPPLPVRAPGRRTSNSTHSTLGRPAQADGWPLPSAPCEHGPEPTRGEDVCRAVEDSLVTAIQDDRDCGYHGLVATVVAGYPDPAIVSR